MGGRVFVVRYQLCRIMATTDAEGREDWGGTRLTLDLWHPNCWAIEVTGRTDGGVLAHAIYNSPRTDADAPDSVNGLFTAFAETTDEVEALLDAIRDSDRAGNLLELQERSGRAAPGHVVRFSSSPVSSAASKSWSGRIATKSRNRRAARSSSVE
jgi:hypothetical protein